MLGWGVLSSGCAAIKATQQPPKRNLAVLDSGVPRTHVIAELGAPVWSQPQGQGSVDVFTFKQGYTKTTKATRALVHAGADVATLGLWEIIGIPAETLADGTDVQVEVHYGPQQTVEHVKVIKGEKVVNPPPSMFARKRPAIAPPPSLEGGATAQPAQLAAQPAYPQAQSAQLASQPGHRPETLASGAEVRR
jgi:hypothetical protein